ncbi:isoflavone 2'-hydroxylase-like [Carica papaya]|uniref:isoflavone 2'-hydroxylase-like n=1 Tax=Carica papaya TaxID=3649 RepID=UPI000B8CB2CB|nr:isoflavone 2'-hydroxylase-like [Carica papaya]
MAVWYLYSLLLFLPVFVFTKHFLNKIQNLPPTLFPCLPIIGHLYLLKQPIYRTLSRISEQNGDVLLLRFGSRKVLVVSSPSAAEECFTKNDVVFANRPRFLIGKHLAYNFSGMSWAPYGDHWRNLRRISSLELLSASRLQMLYHIRADEVKNMIRNFLKCQDCLVDLRTSFFELTLNMMMRMIAGKRYYGENVEDVKEAKRFREFHAETFKLSGSAPIGDFIPWVKSWDLEKRMIECQKKRDEFMQDLDGFFLMPFGYGRRSCPGDGLAMRVIGLTLGSLIQCFEWSRVDDEMVDMSEGVCFTLQKAKPLQAKCRTRAAMADLPSRM